MVTRRGPDPAWLVMAAVVAALGFVLWSLISGAYHTGAPHYTMYGPTMNGIAVVASADPAFADTVRESLGAIPHAMGPAWEFDVRAERPDVPHILVVPISGLEGGESPFQNCLNPGWRGSADLWRGIVRVCTDWWRGADDVRHAVLHETLHVAGVGHYFGPGPNVMCSGEDGRNTCTDMSSIYDLGRDPDTVAALLHLYGEDGWKPPNNMHPCPKYNPGTGLCEP